MLIESIKNSDAVLIKNKANLSYAGTILRYEKGEQNMLYMVLKPSSKSGLLISIPFDEIDTVYLKNGSVIMGEKLYEYI